MITPSSSLRAITALIWKGAPIPISSTATAFIADINGICTKAVSVSRWSFPGPDMSNRIRKPTLCALSGMYYRPSKKLSIRKPNRRKWTASACFPSWKTGKDRRNMNSCISNSRNWTVAKPYAKDRGNWSTWISAATSPIMNCITWRPTRRNGTIYWTSILKK